MRTCIVVLVGVIGCSSADIDGSIAGSAAECTRDRDCVPAGVRCCDCPTFAVPLSNPAYQACSGVRCPDMHCPNNVRAACDTGRCVLACVAMECPQSCMDGFAADASSCLTCTCAEPTANGCKVAADCVRARADCCGCDHGGHDTAVLRQDADDHDAHLRCPANPECPSGNTCDPAAAVQCIQGRCALTSAGELPPAACGRLDLPPCPSLQACVINADPIANEEGVGVCIPTGS